MKALVLEGPPHERMRGWRHFQIIIRLGAELKINSALAQAGGGEQFARQLRGKFFAAGTWEAETGDMRNLNRFPAPLPEILDLLFSPSQTRPLKEKDKP